MKTSTRTLLVPLALLFALAACQPKGPAEDAAADTANSEQPEELAPGQPSTPPMEPPADAVLPVTVAANAFPVGSAAGADGAAAAPKPSYSVSDTLYASLPAGRFPAGGTARIYWTYAQDGTSHKEEEKTIGSGPVTFQFSSADGLKAGLYNVQIDVNDRPVGIVDMTVQ
jgi:predicted small lipoprotein YifL